VSYMGAEILNFNRIGPRAQIRGTHQYSFRSGQWADLVALVWFNDRPCYEVRFEDGYVDEWPIIDSSDPYEIRPKILL